MENFVFQNPTRILFGRGQIAALKGEVPKGAKVMLLAGGGSIKANGVYDQVRAALADFQVVEFWGIEPNPAYETLVKAIALAKAEQVEFLLAVGGGSVLDGTKFVSLGVFHEGDPWDLLAKQRRPRAALPIGCVMTLPATGSEMNNFAVISRTETQEKLAFGHPLVFPKFSILDPETTFSLPPRQVANGIVDAFVHVVEQYLTFPAQAPLQDRYAEGLLRTLVEVGPRTLAEPADYDARASFVWCATQALNGLIACGVPQDWCTHTIGHELTAFHGLDHAQSLAVVLPNLLWVQRDSKREKLLQFAERVWDVQTGSEATRLEAGIVRTRAFFESLGVPTRLEAHGVGSEHFEEIVARFERRGLLPMGERRTLDAARVWEILTLCR